MAQPTNTHDSYDATNSNKEDLQDIIFMISPTETPIVSSIAQGKAANTLHEWVTDDLQAVDSANAQIEGDDKTGTAITAPSRLTNYTQISDKVAILSNTQIASDAVGTNDELGRQVAKKGQEVKRDMEAIISSNQAPVAGNATTARKLRPLDSWYVAANSSRGSGGAAGTSSTAATDGTLRNLTETMLKTVIQAVWNSGGNPDMIVCGGTIKQKISGFGANANRMIAADEQKLVAAIDVYVSDFGTLKIVPDRFSRSRDVHVLQSDMLSLDVLRPMYQSPLAKTGDSEKVLVGCEYTLCVRNPNAHGVVADIQ